MSDSATHIVIADRINSILGNGVIKNLPLFFGGNIAPDAIHAKKDYVRTDKKRTHLCDGIRSYGYGYPETARMFRDRVNDFIENYYMAAGEDKNLYFGYIVHLLVDEFNLFTVYDQLVNHLKNNGANFDEPGFRRKISDEVNEDPQEYNEAYINIIREISSKLEISAVDYDFKLNAVDMLEAVWDYEVKDYISANEINISKRWVINHFFKNGKTKSNDDRETAVNFVGLAANDAIKRLSCKDGIVRLLR